MTAPSAGCLVYDRLGEHRLALPLRRTELNASFWHAPTLRELRIEMLREHLGADTSALDDRTALALYRERANENAARYQVGEALRGLAFALDPATYAG